LPKGGNRGFVSDHRENLPYPSLSKRGNYWQNQSNLITEKPDLAKNGREF
jgi:hypothetical protein